MLCGEPMKGNLLKNTSAQNQLLTAAFVNPIKQRQNKCGLTLSLFPSGKLRILVLRSPHIHLHAYFLNAMRGKKLISPKFDSVENCELAIGVKSSPEKPFLLCSKHYAVLYRQLNTPQPCANCGVLNDLIHAEITKQIKVVIKYMYKTTCMN